jgi:DNA-binding response OmpR family regulator
MSSDKLKVLIVDDDPMQIELVSRTLRSDGFEVSSSTSPIGVSNVVRTFAPDVVLIDVNIPALSGDRLLTLAKKSAPGHTLFVLYSASDETTLRRLAADVFADGWISKSTTGIEVGTKLRALCARRATKPS